MHLGLTHWLSGEAGIFTQCTVRGGREGRDIDAVELARAVEALGAGEILLNCIDTDGQCAARFPFKSLVRVRVVLMFLLAAGVFQVALLGIVTQ